MQRLVVESWASTASLTIANGTVLAQNSSGGSPPRPQFYYAISRGIVRATWDPQNNRYAYKHLNDDFLSARGPAPGGQVWRTTGLGDACTHMGAWLPRGGALLLGVGDGGVARTLDKGRTWQHVSYAAWPPPLNSQNNQGQNLLLADSDPPVVIASTFDRGVSKHSSVLASWDGAGARWTLLGGYDGVNRSRAVNGLLLPGGMRNLLAVGAVTGGSRVRLFAAANTGTAVFETTLDVAAPAPAVAWTSFPLPAPTSARFALKLSALLAPQEIPNVLFAARSDAVWARDTQPGGGTPGWFPIVASVMHPGTPRPAFYNARSLAVVRDAKDPRGFLRLLVGAGALPGGELPGVYRSTAFAAATASAAGAIAALNFTRVFQPSDAIANKSSPEFLAMRLTSLAQLAVRGAEVHVGLEAGDYFLGCQPRHLYVSNSSGEAGSFAVNAATETFSNKNVLGLQFSPEGKLCAGTCDSLQCVV